VNYALGRSFLALLLCHYLLALTTHLHSIFASVPCTSSHESITLDTGTKSSTKHSYFSQSAVLLYSDAAAIQALLLKEDSR
jgi:hypothetical protein